MVFCYSVYQYVKKAEEVNHTEDWRASSEPNLESCPSGDDDEAEETE